MANEPEQGGDEAADVQVTEFTIDADGTVHASLDMNLGGESAGDGGEADEPEPDGNDDPGPDVIGGLAKVAGKVLGTVWDTIKPSD